MSPTKVRRVMALIRGKDVTDAMNILKFMPNHATEPLSKVVKSAAANHADRFGTSPDELRIVQCFVDGGPTLKRIHPRAMGRAYRIIKRTSHITVIVAEKPDAQPRGRRRSSTAHSHDGHDHSGHSH
jgi:large subunit ribosomal protein L22